MRKFTSDTHYGHANIISFCDRPFRRSAFEIDQRDVNVMNTSMLRAALDSLDEGDELVHVGDVALGKIAVTLRYLSLIPSPVTLVAGNHDRCHPCNKGFMKWRDIYRDEARLEPILENQLLLKLSDGTWVKVCHFPYAQRDDGMEDRHGVLVPDKFAQWRPEDDGKTWLLHGHVHNAWRQKGRMINVGVDAWGGRPVFEEEITALITAGPRDLPSLPWEI
jgi:calcineurin-like phosphoesterase family protein